MTIRYYEDERPEPTEKPARWQYTVGTRVAFIEYQDTPAELIAVTVRREIVETETPRLALWQQVAFAL